MAVKDPATEVFKVFPNPAKTVIEFSETLVDGKIYNTLGEKILDFNHFDRLI